ncbi:hypothetical protein LCGC14_1461540 [marine sediment metagenome]|uniref:Uncharacterized protein n=1 Tax=marine sediment metagenome TaxID=412755 RepID=A0A0F9LVK7_9ZZZZ
MSTTLTPIDTKPIESRLAILYEQATSIQVRDQESYTLACQIALDARKEIKAVGFVLDPGINSAREHLETLRNQKAAFVNRVTPIAELASGKASLWREEERRAAEVEQEKLNADRRRVAAAEAERGRIAAERDAEAQRKQREKEIEQARKAGEFGKRDANRLSREATAQADADVRAAQDAAEAAAQVKEVKVKPSIPKMAGIKGRTNWKFRILNYALIPGTYRMADEAAIGRMVRAAKDKKKAEAACPGIEVWSVDAV